MDLNRIADQHYDWVERMGWHNKNSLETLALIGSEVGESVDECLGKYPTDKFGMELADIVLRVVDFAKVQSLDLISLMALAKQKEGHSLFAGTSPLEVLAFMSSDLAKAVNTCRGAAPTEELGSHLANVLVRVQHLAAWQGVNLELEIDDKLALNEKRGTRGRRI
ncbi:MAG: hypothetical protein Q7U16_14750 [Agitococcus sp.]|nr:hypothetical protein [Agitococcus sp.]